MKKSKNWLSALSLCALGLYGLAGLAGLATLGSCTATVPPSSSGDGVIALFNPASSPAVVPAPTDLVRVGGQLQIPVDPAESTNGALKTFNNYLRGLDGFPPDTVAATTFSAALDASSLSEGVVVYDATAQHILSATEASAALDANAANKRLVISTQSRWTNGHTYLVALLSWQEGGAARGLRGGDGKNVIADTAFAFLRSQTPLFAKCQDATNSACACPLTSVETTCHSVVDGLTDAQAQQLEFGRLGIQPLMDAVLASKGRSRSDLVMAWSFTISSRSFATFDPDRSQAPFPSNLLLSNKGIGDPMADVLVSVPVLPTDDARTAALKGGLNTLDGFTTTGSVQFPVDTALAGSVPVDIDSATVIPGKTAFLLNITNPTQQPTFSAQPLHALLDPTNSVVGFAKQIWVTPLRPLVGDRTSYVSVLTTDIKDANGNALVPSPAILLLTQGSPLTDSDGHSTISTVTDVQAAQLEFLRGTLKPLIAQLGALGIPSSKIASFTVYRTQSVVKPLLQLIAGTAQLAGAGAIPTAVTISSTTTTLPPQLGNVSAIVHGTLTVRRVVDLLGPFNTARLAASPANNDVIPFMMTLPLSTLAPAGGAPVVIAQHGLTRWRGDTLAIANAMAGKGLAMIAIDVIYHGSRVVCLSDADCATGVTCTAPAPTATQPGKCNGLPKPSPTASPIPGTTDVQPDSSLPNRDFTNLANPFALRDNFRQHTLDLFQLVRVIQSTATGNLAGQIAAIGGMVPAINGAKIGYLGQSLGAILGANFLAMTPNINLGVLNVGGGDVVDIFSDPTSQLSTGVAAKLGVVGGTPEFYALLENFRWIMDPGEPLNLARFVRAPDSTLMPTRTATKVILQESGNDLVIPNRYTLALGKELGLPLDANQHLMGIDQEGTGAAKNVTTFYSTADHGALFDFVDATLTAQIQDQAVTYLSTGLGGAAPTVK